jgi:hypothetical protein
VPGRTAPGGTVHDDFPGPGATTSEYGHPGTDSPAALPRPFTRQNSRPGPTRASGRSHAETSTASRTRPSGQDGSGSPARARRTRANPIWPAFRQSYKVPWPRRNPGTSDNRARSVTRPGAKLTGSSRHSR